MGIKHRLGRDFMRLLGIALTIFLALSYPSYSEVLKPGSVFTDCDLCPQMIVVPPGQFVMGSSSDGDGRDTDEGPQHAVIIKEPFAVGVFEVTFSQWDFCHIEGGCSHSPFDAEWGRGERPVIYVNWNDAREYVIWLYSPA